MQTVLNYFRKNLKITRDADLFAACLNSIWSSVNFAPKSHDGSISISDTHKAGVGFDFGVCRLSFPLSVCASAKLTILIWLGGGDVHSLCGAKRKEKRGSDSSSFFFWRRLFRSRSERPPARKRASAWVLVSIWGEDQK